MKMLGSFRAQTFKLRGPEAQTTDCTHPVTRHGRVLTVSVTVTCIEITPRALDPS